MAEFITNCGFVPTLGGTSDWTYSSAVTGYQSPASAQAVNGALYVVRAQSADNTQWEYAVGAYNSASGVFARTTVLYNSSGSGTKQGGGGTKINFSSAPALVSVVAVAEELLPAHTAIPCGRLTLTSGTAVTTSDVTAATTVYYTPSNGNIIPLYDGSIWVPIKFSETSLSLSGFTADKVYDVWGRISSGALALDTTVWTDDFTRATAITQQDGIDVKSGDTTRRLLGTIRTTGTTGQTEDSAKKRYISNRYNDVPRSMLVTESTSFWTYSTSTYRQANANTANQIDFVTCVPRLVVAEALGTTANTNTSTSGLTGIGVNSTSTDSSTTHITTTTALANTACPSKANYIGYAPVGRTKLVWLENAQGGGTMTWFGVTNGGVVGGNYYISGISGVVTG